MSNPKEVIKTELKSFGNTFESVMKKQIEDVNKNQLELAQKMKELIEVFDQISQQLPKQDLSEGIQRLNKICERLVSCKNRVKDVNRRAEMMSLALDYKPPPPKQTVYFETIPTETPTN